MVPVLVIFVEMVLLYFRINVPELVNAPPLRVLAVKLITPLGLIAPPFVSAMVRLVAARVCTPLLPPISRRFKFTLTSNVTV